MGRILLVEDHRETREVLAQMLEIHGHAVDWAESAEGAWETLSRHIPDAIIADQRLPGMSGLALLDRMRRNARFRRIPVVICSGDDSQRDAALSAGAADFWIKGSDGMFESIAKLGEILERKRPPNA